MPDLVRQIGEEQRTVQLRQAVVTVVAAANDGVCTIKLGNGTPIAGVRMLASANVTVNAIVWVLQQGYDLLVLGPVWAVKGGGTMFMSGLELYNGGSTPYIDFHRAADAAGDSNADYNVRLINNATGFLELLGGRLRVGWAEMGTHPAHTDYAWFGRTAQSSGSNYAFLTSGADTLVNSTTNTFLAVNGTHRLKVTTGIVETNGAKLYSAWTSGAVYDHSTRAIQAIGGNYYVGCSFWNQAQGAAPMLVQDTGDRIHVMTNPGTGWTPIKASAFEVGSSLRHKSNVRAVERADAREKLRQLRPIRFKREHTSCANCKGQGQISPVEYLEHVYGAQRTEDTPAELFDPQPCPVCAHNGTPGKINTPTIDLNDDKDFLSFAAEEVVDIYPEAVTWEPSDRADPMSTPRPGAIDIMGLLTAAIVTIQELDARLDALEPGRPSGDDRPGK